MFKKTALVAGIGLALSVTAQADYRWELDAGYARGNFDYDFRNTDVGNYGDDTDVDIFSVGGTYFFENVDTSKGPLGEAAFLDHASSLRLGFSDGEIDISSGDDEDGQSYSADMRYVAEGPGWKLSGVIFDVNYERSEPGDFEVDTWGVGVGKYLTPNTTFVLGWENVNINNGGDADRWGAEVEHFFAFSSGGLMTRAGGGKTVVSGIDDPTSWNIGGTWYMGNNLGFGADYIENDISGFEANGFRVNAEWFITENFALDLSYSDIQPDDIDVAGRTAPNGTDLTRGQLETGYDEIGISALYRF